jgi:hypothetical protein
MDNRTAASSRDIRASPPNRTLGGITASGGALFSGAAIFLDHWIAAWEP